jgi:septum site-determining protein MinD
MPDSRVYTVAGAKGGVGKTTVSLNLGAAFAAAGATVVVVEMDLAMANMVDFLSLDADLKSAPTMHDVLAGRVPVEDALYPAPGDIDVVPSGVALDSFAATDVDRLDDVLPTLRAAYDLVIMDTGAGLSQETVQPLGRADDVVLVSTPRVAAIRDVEKTMELTDRAGGSVAGIVFTKSGTGKAPPPEKLANFLQTDLLGHVPEDRAVTNSQDEGIPVVMNQPASQAATAFRDIVSRLNDLEMERQRAGTGFVEGDFDGEIDLELRDPAPKATGDAEAEEWTGYPDDEDEATAEAQGPEPTDQAVDIEVEGPGTPSDPGGAGPDDAGDDAPVDEGAVAEHEAPPLEPDDGGYLGQDDPSTVDDEPDGQGDAAGREPDGPDDEPFEELGYDVDEEPDIELDATTDAPGPSPTPEPRDETAGAGPTVEDGDPAGDDGTGETGADDGTGETDEGDDDADPAPADWGDLIDEATDDEGTPPDAAAESGGDASAGLDGDRTSTGQPGESEDPKEVLERAWEASVDEDEGTLDMEWDELLRGESQEEGDDDDADAADSTTEGDGGSRSSGRSEGGDDDVKPDGGDEPGIGVAEAGADTDADGGQASLGRRVLSLFGF